MRRDWTGIVTAIVMGLGVMTISACATEQGASGPDTPATGSAGAQAPDAPSAERQELRRMRAELDQRQRELAQRAERLEHAQRELQESRQQMERMRREMEEQRVAMGRPREGAPGREPSPPPRGPDGSPRPPMRDADGPPRHSDAQPQDRRPPQREPQPEPHEMAMIQHLGALDTIAIQLESPRAAALMALHEAHESLNPEQRVKLLQAVLKEVQGPPSIRNAARMLLIHTYKELGREGDLQELLLSTITENAKAASKEPPGKEPH